MLEEPLITEASLKCQTLTYLLVRIVCRLYEYTRLGRSIHLTEDWIYLES
jgi:hypothetical protein